MSILSADSWDFKQSTRNISPTINQANIVDLHPASVYSIRMYSFNKIGRSEPSKGLTVSTEEAGEPLTLPSTLALGSGTPGALTHPVHGQRAGHYKREEGREIPRYLFTSTGVHLLGLFQVGCSTLASGSCPWFCPVPQPQPVWEGQMC